MQRILSGTDTAKTFTSDELRASLAELRDDATTLRVTTLQRLSDLELKSVVEEACADKEEEDASARQSCSFDLTVLDCLQGLEHSIRMHLFIWTNFNVDGYEHFDRPDHGNLSWVLPEWRQQR